MNIYVNDLPFRYKFANEYTAKKKLIQWVDVCFKIKNKLIGDKVMTAVDELISIDFQTPQYPIDDSDINIYQLISSLGERETIRMVYYLLSDLPTCSPNEIMPFIFDKKESKGCSECQSEEGILLSLETNSIFNSHKLVGTINSSEVIIDNITLDKHIDSHSSKLGILIFEGNEKHQVVERSFEKGQASRMTLTDEEAQRLLNISISDSRTTSNKRYAKLDETYYTFQLTGGNVYHGYEAAPIDEGMRSRVDKINWKQAWDEMCKLLKISTVNENESLL